ncbi:hypothetical protein [Sodalis sp. RH20]|uniref:hypothetical protein n=1 Tax=unclassified Sodalis (in: enterobacteria) TaxID=2636512 RepID=UPI0039B4DDFC
MTEQEKEDLRILQVRVGAAEYVIRLLCSQHPEGERKFLAQLINQEKNKWSVSNPLITEIMDQALSLIAQQK